VKFGHKSNLKTKCGRNLEWTNILCWI